MHRIGAATLALMALLAVPGCYYDVEEELYPTGCVTTNVTYAQTIDPIIQSRCATPGCHVSGGSAPGDFATYAGVQASVSDGTFKAVVIDSRSMPPTGALSACDLNKIQVWLNAGALNN